MRRLTLKEVQEQHGGKLPHDATFRPDDDEEHIRTAPPTTKAGKPKNRTRSGRFAALNAFVDVGISELTGAQVKVWLILFRDMKATTGTARTGQADIARRAGLTVRGVRKTLAALKTKGFIRVVHLGRLNAGPSVYRVHPTGTT